jgi:hypothetical protein
MHHHNLTPKKEKKRKKKKKRQYFNHDGFLAASVTRKPLAQWFPNKNKTKASTTFLGEKRGVHLPCSGDYLPDRESNEHLCDTKKHLCGAVVSFVGDGKQ